MNVFICLGCCEYQPCHGLEFSGNSQGHICLTSVECSLEAPTTQQTKTAMAPRQRTHTTMGVKITISSTAITTSPSSLKQTTYTRHNGTAISFVLLPNTFMEKLDTLKPQLMKEESNGIFNKKTSTD